jgi:CheY-like chemotaxis protein
LEQEERCLLAEAASEVASRYPLRILLVEDHKINQKVIKKLLSKIGYPAEDANNGWEALERLENNQFDLVLLDVPMPVMDGIRATQEISRQMSQETQSRR